jgi:predicted enzyme related to lactoylglutathione lyase
METPGEASTDCNVKRTASQFNSTPSLAFVERYAQDLDAGCDWYARFLNRPPSLVDAVHRFALFTLDGTAHLSLRQGPATAGDLLYFHTTALDAEIQRLAELGIEPIGPEKQSPEGYRRILFADPAGQRVGLFEMFAERQSG